MKKITILLFTLLFIVSCNTTKNIARQLNTGNYDVAITNALNKLSTNKTRKNKQEAALLLKQAYIKATDRDLNNIELLKKDSNPERLEDIFNLYKSLRNRQEQIKPILPVYHNGREIKFTFKNYSSELISYRNKTSDYLYQKANNLLNTDDKFNARQAYDDFLYIDKINPNYKDIRNKQQEALFKGRDFILMNLKNETQQIIPKRLEDELLNISSYGLNDLWTEYHNNKQPRIKYDYEMALIFNNINISPERITDREVTQEKLVKDGFKYVLDENGNVKKDSLGNDIKEDKFIKVVCQYFETRQFKTASITATTEFKDLRSRQLLDRFPLESTFLFEHFFATFTGDKRALDGLLLDYINNRRIQFPSNEQMVYDAGEDLKLRLKSIITNQKF